MTGNSPTSIAELEQWFSIPRMNTYRNSENPESFYIWNTQLSKAYLEDIQHVEVLLRNRVDAQLRSARGPFWFEDDSYFRFAQQFKKALTTAKRRTKTNDSPGKIITAQQVTFKRRK
ncbi:Abi family protein [Corynebacterium callunae]|uniref:Abi family protein n=1 Tax=Corynebacterium callunae TaxID=1721 RepID=UPI001B7FE2B9|nr:Abi family protein [Corynebacterium callunae]